MTGEPNRQNYINEINRIRKSLNLKEYDLRYLNSLNPDQLKNLYDQQIALAEPVEKADGFNKKLLIIPAFISILILLAVLLISIPGEVSESLHSEGYEYGPGEELEDIACICDIEPGVCDDVECDCDPLCTQE